MGKLYLEMEEPEKAKAQLERVDLTEPDPDYYYLLAKAFNETGDREKAYELLIDSLSLEPNDSAHEMLVQISEQLNKGGNIEEKIWEKRLERAKPAVDFTLPDTEGNMVSLKDHRGRIVLINFWIPACGPCEMELPHIQKIHDKYKDKGLTVLLIQSAQTMEEGKNFLEGNKYTMISLFTDAGWAEENYGVTSCPTNFFIDRQGRILFKSTGYTPGDEEKIESQIRELLEFSEDEMR